MARLCDPQDYLTALLVFLPDGPEGDRAIVEAARALYSGRRISVAMLAAVNAAMAAWPSLIKPDRKRSKKR